MQKTKIYNDETFGKALDKALKKLGLEPSQPITISPSESWQVEFKLNNKNKKK